MVTEHTRAEPDSIVRWSETLDALHGRIAHRFARGLVTVIDALSSLASLAVRMEAAQDAS